LTKLGVYPELGRRGEYKTAVNTFTETRHTEPHEVSLQAVMQSNFEQMVNGIATSRGLSADSVRMLFNQGPFSSSQAERAKLVDRLLYRDEVYDSIRNETDRAAQFISIEKYWRQVAQDEPEEPVIAVIYGVGAVHLGKSESSRLFGTMSMGSDTVTQAFRAAAKDDKVKAIIFRVNSPGGSYVASDTIWRQVLLTREAGKPVVVSMGDVAASGGYFVSIGADKIVAQPSTLTGSIGVFAGKAVTRDFWTKLGVTWDEVHTSDHATMWSSTREYTPAEWEILQKWLDRVYEDFTTKVSKSRDLPLDQVQEAAKGRVWTGAMAKSLGLVDELGGFPEAARIAKELAHIPVHAEARLEVYPEEKSTIELIVETLWGNDDEDLSSEDTSLELLASAAKTLEILHRAAATAGLLPNSEVLSSPEARFMHGR
ncbi:MAG: signal peptide peptidase SppA, partial [Desulforhabdus sp.]|nr:signal peptide peptidase SppA [Desulforhabdus sp.]